MSGDLTRNYFYTPISSQVRVTANNCFYLKVYSGNLSALKNTFNLREDLAFGASIVPAVANPPVYAATDHWIRILSPSGGERWQPGSTRQIMWMSNKVDKVLVGLKNDTWINPSSTANYISPNFQAIPAAMGYYAWTINTSFLPSGANNRYKITVDEYNPDGTVGVGDESGYITIAP